MNKYDIFLIKKEIYNIYEKNPQSLFKTLYNLKNMNKNDLTLGLSIYNEICDIINRKKIDKYMNILTIKRKTKNKYLINNFVFLFTDKDYFLMVKKLQMIIK